MDRESLNQRLSAISTQWTLLFQAHQGSSDTVATAQCQLMQRYSGAVFRYFLGALRDPEVAAELSQEFALRFVRGDFRRADPERGRFRDYLKKALIHMVTDYHRTRQAWPRQLDPAAPEPADSPPQSVHEEEEFLKSWREELLERTWQALAEAQPTYHAVLLYRVENPDALSAEMAQELSVRLGKPLNAAAARKAAQRAHEQFADLLLDEIQHSLGTTATAALREELIALDLLRYCRSALERREAKG
jgi:RNA polymerase sigma-70 factor (ECF subfamily)